MRGSKKTPAPDPPRKCDVAVTALHGPATERRRAGWMGGKGVRDDNSSPSFQPTACTYKSVYRACTQNHTHPSPSHARQHKNYHLVTRLHWKTTSAVAKHRASSVQRASALLLSSLYFELQGLCEKHHLNSFSYNFHHLCIRG